MAEKRAQKREKPMKKAEEKAGKATGRSKEGAGVPGGEPVAFFGYPELLQGEVPLTNTGDQKLRRAVFRIENCELCATGGGRLTEIVAKPRLLPGATTVMPVFVALDPATAPGSYAGEIVVGDERRPAVFHVAERTSVTVTPSRIILDCIPGAAFEKTLFIQNHGNVPLNLGDIGIIVLEQEDLSCRVLRASACELEHPDLDTAVGTVVKNLRRVYEEVPPLKIRTLNKPVTIPPAATVKADIRIQIPESLPKGRECRGFFRIYDASVTVLLRGHLALDTPVEEGEGEQAHES